MGQAVGHLEIGSSVGEFLSHNGPWSSLFDIQSLVLPSNCEVSQRKLYQKPPVNAEFLEFVIKRRSTNHSWRPSSKAAPKSNLIEYANRSILSNAKKYKRGKVTGYHGGC